MILYLNFIKVRGVVCGRYCSIVWESDNLRVASSVNTKQGIELQELCSSFVEKNSNAILGAIKTGLYCTRWAISWIFWNFLLTTWTVAIYFVHI